jgi:hypothetical protein
VKKTVYDLQHDNQELGWTALSNAVMYVQYIRTPIDRNAGMILITIWYGLDCEMSNRVLGFLVL